MTGRSPHKWMNFYTKVLSRFVTVPGLKIEAPFEVPPEGVTTPRAEETKTALRELGLREGFEGE